MLKKLFLNRENNTEWSFMKSDKEILRDLAQSWMELANMPKMTERKNSWRSLKDLQMKRPMILIAINNCLSETLVKELECKDSFLRSVELKMRTLIKRVEEVGDDYVIEPHFDIGLDISTSDCGVNIETIHSKTKSIGYQFNFPIKTPEDVNLLKPVQYSIDHGSSNKKKKILEDAFGDILPVRMHYMILGFDRMMHTGLTSALFSLIGLENMMFWMYDEPDALHSLMKYLRDERISQYKWLEKQNLLELNNDNTMAGSGSYGYISSLPAEDYVGKARCKDLWCFVEAQETVNISPESLKEFFLPYLSDVCSLFGKVYYGCCEPVDDRWEQIKESISDIRAVSISPWCKQEIMAEKLGKDYVFSRKPMPSYISGADPDWDMLRKDVSDTARIAKNCNYEILFRDIYDVNGDISRFSRWVDMARSFI